MKNYRERFFLTVLVLCGLAGSGAQAATVTPYYQIRSQGTNAAREMVGWQQLINLCCQDDWYGAGAVALEYSQSFRSNRMCECLFGDALITSSPVATDATPTTACDTDSDCKTECDTCSISISGSCVDDRDGTKDFLADYFGLPTDFQSTVSFSPKIKNFVADFQFYFGLDSFAEGLYFRVNMPLTHTRWDLHAREEIINKGTNPYLIGYFGPTGIPTDDLLHSALDFFAGKTPDLGAVTFDALQFSKWSVDGCESKSKSKTRLADVEAALGYNFVCNEDYVFGLNARATAPAGNRPEAEFLFEPMVGSGHFWELGGGINTGIVLWRSCEDKSRFSFYLDANVTHLFSTRQTRVFDLCSAGNNSRYMLAQKLGANVDDLSTDRVTGLLSDFQFVNHFAPVANLTASPVDVSVSVQGDLALQFTFATECGFNWSVGYELWGKACEKLCRQKGCNAPVLSEWALKGDAHVYGFAAAEGPSVPVALAATQSTATIHQGTNFPGVDCTFADAPANTIATGALLAATANPRIDNVQPAFVGFGNPLFTTPALTAPQTNTSIQPIVLQESDVSIVTSSGISHKVFTHFSYTWETNECRSWRPFIGVGASAEFAQRGSCGSDCDDICNTVCPTTTPTTSTTDCNSCDTSCEKTKGNCVRCSNLNQWAVWVKGGIAY
ncbi:MAG TPA: hypothetical protein VGT41_06545 [Candidatus Babeliales bacterium]|nr:hypothetical protein [Candidatus Babeliales bacterium]